MPPKVAPILNLGNISYSYPNLNDPNRPKLLVVANSYSNLETDFSNDSILSKIIINPVLYAVFYGFIKSISIFINGIFACYLVDVMKSFIKGALFFVLFLWVLSTILYYFLPFEFVPMTSLMITSYSNLNIIQIFSPYLIYIAIYLVSKCVVSYEV